MGLGSNLAHLRKAKGWTLDDLAGESGVGRAVIHAIESRGSRASKHAPALAKALGVQLDTLLADAPLPPFTAHERTPSYVTDPQLDQALDDLRDLQRLDPDTRARLLSDLHNAADRARAIARRATTRDKAKSAASTSRPARMRSSITIRYGDGNPNQGSLPLVPAVDPFNATPDDRELALYARIAKDRERHPK